MINLKKLLIEYLNEVMDIPYSYNGNFKTEMRDMEDEIGEKYSQEVLQDVQLIKFKTDDGVEYLWYARRDFHNEYLWHIAFGRYKGLNTQGKHEIDIELTKAKNPFKIFATVVSIINDFVDFDEGNEVQYLHSSSKGHNRTQLYLKRLIPLITKFKLYHVTKSTYDNDITLIRVK